MPSIDFDSEIKNRLGKPYKQRVATGEMKTTEVNGRMIEEPEFEIVAVTLASVTWDALMSGQQPGKPNENLSGSEKHKRWKLAMKCSEGVQDLKVEDIAYIKGRIGEVCSTEVVGPAWEILDPDGVAPEKGFEGKHTGAKAKARQVPRNAN